MCSQTESYRSITMWRATTYSIPFKFQPSILRACLFCASIPRYKSPQTYTFVHRSLTSFWEQRDPMNEGVCLFRLAESRLVCNCSTSLSLRSPTRTYMHLWHGMRMRPSRNTCVLLFRLYRPKKFFMQKLHNICWYSTSYNTYKKNKVKQKN